MFGVDYSLSGYLRPDVGAGLNGVSVLGLAHVGDAVFELMARTWLCMQGISTAKRLHAGAVALVSAEAQAAAAGRIMPHLSEEELAVFKRGRNAHVNSIPRGSTQSRYHISTGIEALFGYLYLSGQTDRLDKLFEMIAEG